MFRSLQVNIEDIVKQESTILKNKKKKLKSKKTNCGCYDLFTFEVRWYSNVYVNCGFQILSTSQDVLMIPRLGEIFMAKLA